MKLTIKKAILADAVALSEILTQAMRYKLSLDDSAWGTQPYTVKEVQATIKKGNTYCAWLDDKLVGTLMLLWEDDMVWGEQSPIAAYVHQLAVKDGYHGQSIGEQLLTWANQKAVRQHKELLRIDLPPNNQGLKRYYEKLGFRWIMDREVHAPHAVYTAALYERSVK